MVVVSRYDAGGDESDITKNKLKIMRSLHQLKILNLH
jgi:hypothetical protein